MIANRIYKSKEKPTFDKASFIRLMEIATSGLFMYQGRYYQQTDGVTMGSPLGPTLANFCLAHFEEELLKKQKGNDGPSFYARYVDDIFCVFKAGTQHDAFLKMLNALHPNLKFTVEVGKSSISFLDTHISLPTNDGETFTSRVFRKATYTGLLLNFDAICPKRWKVGLVKCLIHRAYLICSSWKLFTEEIEYLRTIFVKNGYPEHIFWSCVRSFVHNRFKRTAKDNIKQDGVETIFCIPYLGLPSMVYGRKIREQFKSFFGIDVKIVFKSYKVKDCFSLKCQTPLPLLANVVYRFKCLRDVDKVYIGKTKRHLATRVKEHHNANSRSAIHDHVSSCEVCQAGFSVKCFQRIDSGSNDIEVTIKEALHIKYSKPNLNKQLYNSGSSFVLNIF